MYEKLEAVANQLAEIVASQRGNLLSRDIIVTDEVGGDVEITPSRILIHPFYFTEGNPVAVVNHCLDLADKLDEERRRTARMAVNNMKRNLRLALRDLMTYAPDSIQEIVEDELGMGEEDLLILEVRK